VAPTWQGRGRLNWRLYVYSMFPLCVVGKKCRAVPGTKISPLYYSGGAFYSFPVPLVDGRGPIRLGIVEEKVIFPHHAIGYWLRTNGQIIPLHLPLVDTGVPTTFYLLHLTLLMVEDQRHPVVNHLPLVDS
jgi:hypothetical protein